MSGPAHYLALRRCGELFELMNGCRLREKLEAGPASVNNMWSTSVDNCEHCCCPDDIASACVDDWWLPLGTSSTGCEDPTAYTDPANDSWACSDPAAAEFYGWTPSRPDFLTIGPSIIGDGATVTQNGRQVRGIRNLQLYLSSVVCSCRAQNFARNVLGYLFDPSATCTCATSDCSGIDLLWIPCCGEGVVTFKNVGLDDDSIAYDTETTNLCGEGDDLTITLTAEDSCAWEQPIGEMVTDVDATTQIDQAIFGCVDADDPLVTTQVERNRPTYGIQLKHDETWCPIGWDTSQIDETQLGTGDGLIQIVDFEAFSGPDNCKPYEIRMIYDPDEPFDRTWEPIDWEVDPLGGLNGLSCDCDVIVREVSNPLYDPDCCPEAYFVDIDLRTVAATSGAIPQWIAVNFDEADLTTLDPNCPIIVRDIIHDVDGALFGRTAAGTSGTIRDINLFTGGNVITSIPGATNTPIPWPALDPLGGEHFRIRGINSAVPWGGAFKEHDEIGVCAEEWLDAPASTNGGCCSVSLTTVIGINQWAEQPSDSNHVAWDPDETWPPEGCNIVATRNCDDDTCQDPEQQCLVQVNVDGTWDPAGAAPFVHNQAATFPDPTCEYIVTNQFVGPVMVDVDVPQSQIDGACGQAPECIDPTEVAVVPTTEHCPTLQSNTLRNWAWVNSTSVSCFKPGCFSGAIRAPGGDLREVVFLAYRFDAGIGAAAGVGDFQQYLATQTPEQAFLIPYIPDQGVVHVTCDGIAMLECDGATCPTPTEILACDGGIYTPSQLNTSADGWVFAVGLDSAQTSGPTDMAIVTVECGLG